VAHWLVKSEPGAYSYADLERERATDWNGVHNALALRHLKAMRPGEELFVYHSGAERAVVGIARVVAPPRPDPADDRGSWMVRVAPVRAVDPPVTLAQMRADPALAGLPLFRISRLSVLPITGTEWRRILASSRPGLGRQGSAGGSRSQSRAARPRKRGAT